MLVTAFAANSVCAMPSNLLPDIIRQLPRLLDIIACDSLDQLLAINIETRRCAKKHVSGMRLDRTSVNASLLTQTIAHTLRPYSGSLRRLDLSGCDAPLVSLLSHQLVLILSLTSLPKLQD